MLRTFLPHIFFRQFVQFGPPREKSQGGLREKPKPLSAVDKDMTENFRLLRKYRFHGARLSSRCYCYCTKSRHKCQFEEGNITRSLDFVHEMPGRICSLEDRYGGRSNGGGGGVGQETGCCIFKIHPGKEYQAVQVSSTPTMSITIG